MHVDSKSLHYDMGAICSCSPTVSHTHAHICSGNKHAKNTLPLCLIVWRHGGRELSISQMASIKVPERITILYSQSGKHTHIHTQRLNIGKKRPGRLGWRWISWYLLTVCVLAPMDSGDDTLCSHYRYTHTVSSCDVQCYMAPIRLIISGVCPLLLCH